MKNIIVLIYVEGQWEPAHPGKLMCTKDVETVVAMLQADGYATAIVFADDVDKWMPEYKEHEGGDYDSD